MAFEPLDEVEVAKQLIAVNASSKWGHPKYTTGSINSQELRTLCEAVLRLHDEREPPEPGCPVHCGQVHGGEAEELRSGIERLLAIVASLQDEPHADGGELGVLCSGLTDLLDVVDARDSLAHGELLDRIRIAEAVRDDARAASQRNLDASRDAAAEAARLTESHPKCATCGKPAACIGDYGEGPEPEDDYACDACCGHGSEDGYCWPLADIPGVMQTIDLNARALAKERDKLRTALTEACNWWRSHLEGLEKRAGHDGGTRAERHRLDDIGQLTEDS